MGLQDSIETLYSHYIPIVLHDYSIETCKTKHVSSVKTKPLLVDHRWTMLKLPIGEKS
jgi:hypothetical protein